MINTNVDIINININLATMKRHSSSHESGYDAVKVRRQDPVSCAYCRTKKLKCDRESPCSNCRARKLVCSSTTGENNKSIDVLDNSDLWEGSKDLRAREGTALTSGLVQTISCKRQNWMLIKVRHSASYIGDINARLRRLESLLAEKALPSRGPPSKPSNVQEQCGEHISPLPIV